MPTSAKCCLDERGLTPYNICHTKLLGVGVGSLWFFKFGECGSELGLFFLAEMLRGHFHNINHRPALDLDACGLCGRLAV